MQKYLLLLAALILLAVMLLSSSKTTAQVASPTPTPWQNLNATPTSPAGQNLLLNGGMEEEPWDCDVNSPTLCGPAKWGGSQTYAAKSTTAHTGTYSYHSLSNINNPWIYQTVGGLIPGSTYTFTGYYFAQNSNSRPIIGIKWNAWGDPPDAYYWDLRNPADTISPYNYASPIYGWDYFSLTTIAPGCIASFIVAGGGDLLTLPNPSTYFDDIYVSGPTTQGPCVLPSPTPTPLPPGSPTPTPALGAPQATLTSCNLTSNTYTASISWPTPAPGTSEQLLSLTNYPSSCTTGCDTAYISAPTSPVTALNNFTINQWSESQQALNLGTAYYLFLTYSPSGRTTNSFIFNPTDCPNYVAPTPTPLGGGLAPPSTPTPTPGPPPAPCFDASCSGGGPTPTPNPTQQSSAVSSNNGALCLNGPSTATDTFENIYWTNPWGDPVLWVDIKPFSDFTTFPQDDTYFHKSVGPTQTTTVAPNGFDWYSDNTSNPTPTPPGSSLIIQPNQVYYVRLYNGVPYDIGYGPGHSPTSSFIVPACPTPTSSTTLTNTPTPPATATPTPQPWLQTSGGDVHSNFLLKLRYFRLF